LSCYATNAANAAAAVDGNINRGTVCTNSKPFKISVLSDGKESANTGDSETVAPRNVGFELNYYMKTSCITRNVDG